MSRSPVGIIYRSAVRPTHVVRRSVAADPDHAYPYAGIPRADLPVHRHSRSGEFWSIVWDKGINGITSAQATILLRTSVLPANVGIVQRTPKF